ASLKFLLPFAWLVGLGALIPWSVGPTRVMPGSFVTTAVQMTHLGDEGPTWLPGPRSASGWNFALIALGILWALGPVLIAARWLRRWADVRRALHDSTETDLEFVIPVRSSGSQLEPAVIGILRPVLLLPKEIKPCLTTEELQAVLAHERSHVLWRDN